MVKQPNKLRDSTIRNSATFSLTKNFRNVNFSFCNSQCWKRRTSYYTSPLSSASARTQGLRNQSLKPKVIIKHMSSQILDMRPEVGKTSSWQPRKCPNSLKRRFSDWWERDWLLPVNFLAIYSAEGTHAFQFRQTPPTPSHAERERIQSWTAHSMPKFRKPWRQTLQPNWPRNSQKKVHQTITSRTTVCPEEHKISIRIENKESKKKVHLPSSILPPSHHTMRYSGIKLSW